MDFKKDTEQFSFRSGYFIGFLFSYLIFFSILFFVLSKFKVINAVDKVHTINIGYGYYLCILVIIYFCYRLIELVLGKKHIRGIRGMVE
jgi:Na+-driven multidrug efflux pump